MRSDDDFECRAPQTVVHTVTKDAASVSRGVSDRAGLAAKPSAHERDECDDLPEGSHQPNGQGSHLGGIVPRKTASGTLYFASVYIESIVIRSRMTPSLDLALDYLTTLTTAKQYILTSKDQTFEARFRSAFSHGVVEELRLSFEVRVHVKWWWFGKDVGSHICRDVEHVLQAWKVLFAGSSHTRGQVNVSERLLRLRTFPQEWPVFLKGYCDVLEGFGLDSAVWLARLRTLEENSRMFRERYAMSAEEHIQQRALRSQQDDVRALRRLECWNRRRMAAEDRLQRAERHRERRSRAAMSREDKLSSIWRLHLTLESVVLARISKLLERWRSNVRRNRQAAIRANAQRIRKKAAALRAARREKRDAMLLILRRKREIRLQRERRWKGMKPRELTMNDILHARE
eukprot:TRINITY_DN19246_c0_g1_i1.p1 TRINITY_DN19246_c0_g1~~TRINITY_DN19246_c0_g1_i1.p1  ORF type:complete len:402 (+),score=33.40 TRINITY_DN19246_c0_g1_i1:531-1736(+)